MAWQDIEEGIAFGQKAYANQTSFHPVGLAAVVLLGVTMLAVKRRHAVLPILAMACLVAPAQRLAIASLDFGAMRLMILFGLVRVFSRGEQSGFRIQLLDLAVIAWTVIGGVAQVASTMTTGAVINRLGGAYDALGLYFLFRILIKDLGDVDVIAKQILWISIPVCGLFLIEKFSGRNPFSFLGGVPVSSAVRQGAIRCQGPFPHPILAGCFWAVLAPIVASGIWRAGNRKLLTVSGLAAIAGIAVMSGSSTPILTLGLGCLGWAVYPLRHHMRAIRWGIFFALLSLHLVMTKPVWHLLARVSVFGGSTGWHRYALIQRAIDHFDEWWLLGTASTAHWGHVMYDLTNQYVREGVKGGLAAMLFFIAAITLAFSRAGRTTRRVAPSAAASRLCWGMGVALFAHVGMFFAISISHSQQNLLAFYLVPAAIGSSYGSANPGRARSRRTTTRSIEPGVVPVA